jgi:putative peptidyl-prolyl cis-trans isomerase
MANSWLFVIFIYSIFSFSLYSAESLNRVLAIIGKISISQFDLDKGDEIYKGLLKAKKPSIRNSKGSPRNKVLDFLIDRAIIDITADEESIQAGERNVEAEVEKYMKLSNSPDKPALERFIQEKLGITYEVWLNDLPYQMKRGQLMQLRVNVKPPSESEVKSWYNSNKTKVGNEVKFREICLVPKNSSFDEERRITDEINQIRKEVKKDSESFNLIASGPRNQAPGRGLNDWIQTFDVYSKSPLLINALSRTMEGGISEPYRDEKGKYCIVKLEGKRATPLDNIRRQVSDLIMRDKAESSFDDWLVSRRKEVTITVYDKDYISENKLEAPDETFNYNKIEPQLP